MPWPGRYLPFSQSSVERERDACSLVYQNLIADKYQLTGRTHKGPAYAYMIWLLVLAVREGFGLCYALDDIRKLAWGMLNSIVLPC